MTIAPTTEDGIFDASMYDLPIPRMDGHKADTVVVSLGSMNLDRTNEEHLAIVEELVLGGEVELTIRGRVVRKGFRNIVREDGVSNEFGVGLKVTSLEIAG